MSSAFQSSSDRTHDRHSELAAISRSKLSRFLIVIGSESTIAITSER
jgi:hypothetical protein